MPSDISCTRELDHIYASLEKRSQKEAKAAEDATLREDLPSHAKSRGKPPCIRYWANLMTSLLFAGGETTPGRSRNVEPLQPWRTPTKKRGEATTTHMRDLSPTRQLEPMRYKPVLFSQPPGRKKQERMTNSLLPRTPAILDAIARAANARDQRLESGSVSLPQVIMWSFPTD